jgi:hypothetical protein
MGELKRVIAQRVFACNIGHMEQTLRQHIGFLEERLKDLRNELSDPSRVAAELQRVRADLQIAELALSHYRKALDLERRLASPTAQPPLRGQQPETP